MFCKNCGKEIDNNAYVCPSCGVKQVDDTPKTVNADGPSVGCGILGFLIPLVGLIMFIVWRKDFPQKSKSAGIGALVSIVLWVVIVIALVACTAAVGAAL